MHKKIKKIIDDTTGAALIYVIVAATMVVLLGTVTTVTAYINMRTNSVQSNSENNFYSADTIMNVIVSGLESDISKAYETAYTKVITNMNHYENPEAAQEDFKTHFITEMSMLLNENNADQSSAFYNVAHLQGYVEKAYKDDVKYTISAINGNNFLDKTSTGIVLRNLHVTYEDNKGYFDEINTDVKIDVPQFDPETVPPPTVQLNAIVIDDGLEVDLNRGLTINGNTYINERENDKSAILLKPNSYLSVNAPEELIAGGFIQTEDENTELIFAGTDNKKANKIWTENIDLGRFSKANLSGQIFVTDDLEMNGAYGDVQLHGDYYGYGKSSTNADDSSSININGAGSRLNIQDLDMLVIGGTSYISTSTLPSGKDGYTNSKDVQLGESVSVKSNQIAYFVDDKEFTKSKNVAKFYSNPMSYKQYEDMLAANGGESNLMAKIANTRLSYGKTYSEYGATVVPVFSSKDNGTVYLYLNFQDSDKAAKYFVDAYKGDSLLSQRLRTYAAQYLTNLQIGKDTELLVNDNYIDTSILLYTSDTLPMLENGLGYNENNPQQQAATTSYLHALKTKYFDDGKVTGNGEKYKVMYEKTINEAKLKEFIEKATIAKTDHHTDNEIQLVTNGVIVKGTTGAQAIVVDNAGKDAYKLGTGKGLVVVTGDLEITGDWLGTVIVGGRAYVKEGTKQTPVDLTTDKISVSSVIPLYFSWEEAGAKKSMSVINIFKGYESIGTNNATTESGMNADMISHCISFTNWDKN